MLSRRSLFNPARLAASVLIVLGLSSAVIAQDAPERSAEDVFAGAEAAYGPPPPEPKCEPNDENIIVVCAEEEEQDQFRVQSSSELDPDSDEALYDGVPRAPDFAESCKKNPEKGPCIGFGYVPPPAYLIDFSTLPEAPPGSDADRVGRGLAPRGNDTGYEPEAVGAEIGTEAETPAPELTSPRVEAE